MKERGEATFAVLELEDGERFEGFFFGHPAGAAGEVVFNTGMVGYPETLSDPSYHGEILVLTYPLIGNYGIPPVRLGEIVPEYFESSRPHIAGLVVADYIHDCHHWNCETSLSAWLKSYRVPALAGVDTRRLTRKLRQQGVMRGRILRAADGAGETVPLEDPSLRNLVAEVSCPEVTRHGDGPFRVLLVDCGAKHNILRSLLRRGASVVKVPWDLDFNAWDEPVDGIVVSNGPGDPSRVEATTRHLRRALEGERPILGICLGNQLLARAAGGTTFKLPYGHRGQNQPCRLVGSPRCYITSQNHGYAVALDSLPREWQPFFVNANDGTCEGIRHASRPFRAVQFHPEACPGPVDTEFLFDDFFREMKERRR